MKAMAILAAGAALAFGGTAELRGAPKDPISVLANYVGKWEATFSVDGKSEEMKAAVNARWILEKRYVQQTSTLSGASGEDGFSIMTLMTYDAASGSYKKWTFTSAGMASEETGTWDAASNTLTWTGEDSKSGNTTTVAAAFKGKDEEHWSITTTSAAGAMVSRIAGVNRRQ